ncbi:MAG: hypothetical protein JSS09_10255, partial [Verrucomicrobia bacterium]|nr:hypothetical protein [Verrucomicrobiota bacterium]
LREDCRYILHNCYSEKYQPYFASNRAFSLQVYTDDVLTRPGCEKIAPCIYYDLKGRCVYMPWATDLLPKDIEEVKKKISSIQKENRICWVGTIGDGIFGNIGQLSPFKNAAQEYGIGFISKIFLNKKEHMELVASSYMAPAIVGKWQQEKGYIPCRIFKNISYGQMGITNSFRVYELFEKKIVYNSDSEQLFSDALKRIKSMDIKELYELMDFVKENHTYINRIEVLLNFINLIDKN